MPNYQRVWVKGGIYFFTLVTYQRRQLFLNLENRVLFQSSVAHVRSFHPFSIEAYCILPDHIHFIWHLPEDDLDYSMRIGLIKAHFSKQYHLLGNAQVQKNPSRKKRREAAVWQRRFWEHLIRDEEDLHRHIDYIHYNPVKHGLAAQVQDWPDFSFMDYVQGGLYDEDWGGKNPINDVRVNFGE